MNEQMKTNNAGMQVLMRKQGCAAEGRRANADDADATRAGNVYACSGIGIRKFVGVGRNLGMGDRWKEREKDR